jgi:polysaccharide biosynthesis transport protein
MTGGGEALKDVLRRARPLILLLLVLGIVAGNGISHLRGPEYQAEARVLLTTTDLASVVTGAQPVFVDPQLVENQALALATSPTLYERVEQKTGGDLGDASELEAMTEVSSSSDGILVFTTTSDDPDRAVDVVNAVADEFIVWRAELTATSIRSAISEVTRQLSNAPVDSVRRTTLQERLDDLQLLDTLNTGNTQSVEEANEAVKTSPAPVRDSVLGAAIGLIIALLLVGAREAFDTKVRSEEDVEEILNVPVLATVRSLPRRSRLVMFGRHEQTYGDTYALLAASLSQLKRGSKSALVAVTSATAAEGKTSTAANLAVAIARRQTNVILADFDVRNPSVGDIFRLPNQAPGVSAIVNGSEELEDALWDISLDGGPRPTPASENGSGTRERVEGSLRILPAGGPFRKGTIVESPNVPEVLEGLKDAADLVILDTPPALMAVEMAELSRNVDMVLLVVRQGRVSRRSLRALSRQAQSWPTTVVGAVLTDTPAQEYGEYYYGSR